MIDYGYIMIRLNIYRVWTKNENSIDGSIYMVYICAMEELNYIDDKWIADLIYEARLYDGIEDLDVSWYKGEGWYDSFLHKVSGEA